MRFNPLTVQTLLVVWVLAATTSASASGVEPGGQRDRRIVTGTIQLPPGVDNLPTSIEVTLISNDYRHTITASPGGTFVFSEAPARDCVIEVRSRGFETTRTEIRGWPGTNDVVIPLGAAIEAESDRVPDGPATVTVGRLKVPEKAIKLAARAQEESAKQNLTKAVDQLREAVTLCPAFVEAWNNLGVAYLRMSRQKEAESAFLKALETDQKSVPALRNLGLLYLRTNRPPDALSVLTRARAAAGEKDLYIETYLGHALYGTGRYQEAESILLGAVKIKSDFAAALYPLGLAQIRMQHYSEARETLTRFLQTGEKGNEAKVARSLLARLDGLAGEEERKSAE